MNFESLLLAQYNLKGSLMESLDSVIKSNPNIPEQTIRDYHQHALPDGNKSDKLLSHVLKLHKTGEITPDRASELKPHLTALHNTKQLGKLSQLKTLADHTNATTGLEDKTVTKKERVDSSTPVLFENEHIIVKQHLNHESAIKGAMMHPENPMFNANKEPGKASWCLSVGGSTGLGHFNNYTKTGEHPLYTITNKKTNRVHALVADPSKDRSSYELRDEKDDNPYRTNASVHKFMLGHPGIEKTKAGEFLAKISPVAEETRKLLGHNPSTEQIHDIIHAPYHPAHELILDHPAVNTNALLNKIIPDKSISEELRYNAINHKSVNKGGLGKLDHDHITSILNDPEESTRIKSAIVRNPGLNTDHVKTILTGTNDRLKNDLLGNPNSPVTEDDIHHIVSTSTNSGLISNALSHPKANVSHINTVLKRNLLTNRDIHQEISKVPGLSADHITMLLNNKYRSNRSAEHLLRSENFNNSHALLLVKNKPIDSNDNYLRHSTLIDAINHKNSTPDVTKAVIDSKEIDPHNLTFTKHSDLFHSVVQGAIDTGNPEHMARIANSPVLSNDQINTIINHEPGYAGDRYHTNRAKLKLLERSDITSDHISNMIKSSNEHPWELNKAIADHPLFNEDHINQFIKQSKVTGENYAVTPLANHPKLTHDHITDMIKLKDRQLNRQLLFNHKLTPTHLTNILAHGINETGHEAILNHPSLKSSHLDSIITNAIDTDSGKVNQINALNHPKADSSTVEAALKSKAASTLMPHILNHPKLSNGNAKTILQGDNEEHKLAVLHKGKHISGTNLILAQTDKSPAVRLAAISHPNVNLSHINTAISDSDNSVKQAALNVKRQRSIA